MNEVISGIYLWSWFSEPHGYNFNGYLISHDSGNLCIDPVEPGDDNLAEISRLGVTRVLLTNRNHTRASAKVRSRTGARIAIHPKDASHARSQGTEIDDELQVGQKLGPLVVVDASGKSPGEVALHWPEKRLLIAGDVVIGNPPGRCGLLKEAVMDDPVHLRESVRKLLNLDFDTLLTGDGRPIVQGAKARLQELVESFPK